MGILNRCKHDWKLLSEQTTESHFEHAMRLSKGCREINIPSQMCRADRKLIQLVTCTSCGAIKKFVTEI